MSIFKDVGELGVEPRDTTLVKHADVKRYLAERELPAEWADYLWVIPKGKFYDRIRNDYMSSASFNITHKSLYLNRYRLGRHPGTIHYSNATEWAVGFYIHSVYGISGLKTRDMVGIGPNTGRLYFNTNLEVSK